MTIPRMFPWVDPPPYPDEAEIAQRVLASGAGKAAIREPEVCKTLTC
jgi:hypothetical protein